jgi:hypothetical protein
VFPFNHPVLKLGVTVQIGLDKACKLSAVFNRYVEFCNEQQPETNVEVADLEFVHAQVLVGHDTAETAALMKNDRISVRREQSNERREDEARNRVQRDSDKEYFQQLRQLLPTETSSGRTSVNATQRYADAVLDCRGILPETRPLVEATTIKCHSALIHKCCPWLGRKIAAARLESARQSVITVQDETKPESEDEDFELMQQIKVQQPDEQESFAAQIENDDDDLVERSAAVSTTRRASRNSDFMMDQDDDDDDVASFSTDTTRQSQAGNLVWTVIEDHCPEAVKLLLEYCYTNRVVPLGCEAFLQSCKTKPQYKKLQGPVPPYSARSARWPNAGEPTVSFAVALAGVRLAEEADMPRLSLMCEVAAAQLVDHASAVEALSACESQRKLTGNPLPRLRKATMEIVLHAQHTSFNGVASLLKNALAEKGPLLVPTLITGTMEAVEASEKKKNYPSTGHSLTGEKRDWKTMAYSYFDKFDKIDAKERERERRKRRGGTLEDKDDRSAILEDDDMFAFWGETGVRQMSLKRMSHHLGGALGNRIVANLPRRGGSKSNAAGHRRGLR